MLTPLFLLQEHTLCTWGHLACPGIRWISQAVGPPAGPFRPYLPRVTKIAPVGPPPPLAVWDDVSPYSTGTGICQAYPELTREGREVQIDSGTEVELCDFAQVSHPLQASHSWGWSRETMDATRGKCNERESTRNINWDCHSLAHSMNIHSMFVYSMNIYSVPYCVPGPFWALGFQEYLIR